MNPEDEIKVETAMDILLVLLYARGPRQRQPEKIVGVTKLEKLVYLMAKETSLGQFVDHNFKYEPYHFGPYSAEVLDNIEALEELGLVKAGTVPSRSFVEESDRYQVGSQSGVDLNLLEENKTTEIFELSEDGLKVAEALFNSLTTQQQQEITQLKARYNHLDLRQLLRYVYKKYPESTSASKIKDYVLA